MKKLNLKLGYLLVAILTMIGCTEQIEHKISKEGSIGLENIVETRNKYFNHSKSKKFLEKHYNYTDKLSEERLKKVYKLSFYIFYMGSKGYTENVNLGVALLPCDSTLEYDSYEKYPAYDSAHYIITASAVYGVYFKIEDLERLGYIAKDRDEQKDLCLFEKALIPKIFTKTYISSNRLIYKAEEINAIVNKYRSLK